MAGCVGKMKDDIEGVREYKMNKQKYIIKGLIVMLVSMLLAYITASDSYTLVTLTLSKITKNRMLIMAIAFVTYSILFLIASWIWNRYLKAGNRPLELVFTSAGIPFIMCIFMPVETMISNYNDYSFSVIDIFKANLGHFVFFSVAIATFLALLGDKLRGILASLISAIFIDMYVQYMFFNKTLGLLNGGVYNWKDYRSEAIINMILMIGIVVLIMILAIRKGDKVSKVTGYISGFITAIMLVAFVTLFISAPKEAYITKNYICDASEQYMVSPRDNVIIFIFDAADNSQLEEVISRQDGALAPYSDFTIYTNTCSVCDVTGYSLPQMFSGSDFENNYADYEGFYNRLHDHDYVVNFYGYDNAIDTIGLKKYFDNYKQVQDGMWVDYKAIFHDTVVMSTYRVLPLMLKELVDTAEIDFTTQVHVSGFDEPMYFNEDFANNIQLNLRDDGKNAMVVNLLYGTHGPSDDYARDMSRCLEIAADYINELKELGIYDNSTIIITSDHGAHDDVDDVYPYQFPSTPIFMIKEAGRSNDEASFNSAPIYHTDFLATILKAARLDEAADGDRFGSSIYDFAESDMRTRRWYNRNNRNRFQFYTYTFTGNTQNLKDEIDAGRYVMFNN